MLVSQYGVWTNIFDYIGYFVLFSGLLPFWATRFVARGIKGTVKSSILAQLVIALSSMAIYFPVIFIVYTFAIGPKVGTEVYLPFFLIAGLNIFTIHMIASFESILQSVKPQAIGFGFLIEEFVKVGVALVLILGFKQLFLGAITALILSCFVQIGYYVSLLADEFKQKTDWSYLKQWLKGSTAIAYNAIGNQLGNFVLILLFFYGGPNTRAYFQAASSFTIIVGYSLSLSTALYPKLLAKNCTSEDIGNSFRTVMMLAIPLAALTFVMPVSFLTILKSQYGVAWPVLIGLSINTLVSLICSFYGGCLSGTEAFDAEGQISIRRLVKSKIFKAFTLNYVQAAIALPIAYVVLTRLPVAGSVLAALYVVAILIGTQILAFALLYWIMRRSVSIPVAWRSIAKYVLAAALMSGVLYLLPTTTTLLYTIAKAITGFALYIALLLLIDNQARQLIRLIWEEIRGSIKQLTSKGNDGDALSAESANS
jgi:hypothetical protein